MNDTPAPPAPRPKHADPHINPKTGLIEPTVADAMFLAMCTPGYDGSTGLNLLVWGDPGTGKTATAKDVLAQSGRHPYYVDLSLSAPEDLAGIPRVMFAEISEKDGSILRIHLTTDTAPKDANGNPVELAILSVRAIDATWFAISMDPKAVLVADDITNSAQATQAALLRIALEREVSDGKGGLRNLKHMAVLAMANFGDGNALQPLLGPLANRFSHIHATLRDVMRWWNSRRVSQLTIDIDREQTLARDFPKLEAKYWEIVNDFVVEHQLDAFDKAPTEFTTVEEHAYASGRTYEYCVRWLATCEHFGVQPDRFIRASIGEIKGGMFIAWMHIRDLAFQTMANKIQWELLTPDECNDASMWAAHRFTNSRELEGTIRAIDRLVKLNTGSHDNNVPARDYLIHRALGLPVGRDGQVDLKKGTVQPAMTEDQIFILRRFWNDAFVAKRDRYFPERAGHEQDGGLSGAA